MHKENPEQTLKVLHIQNVLQKKKSLLIVLMLGITGISIPFVLYWSEMINGNTIVAGDGLGILYSLKYCQELIKEGSFPLWNPYLAGGMPQGIMVGGVGLYPLNWIVAMAPATVQIYLYLGLHLAMGACFMFGYLRKISCARIVSTAVSLMYIFTVHMGGYRKEHLALIVTALYVPVVLYFAEQYLQNKRLKWLFACSAAMALQFLGGFLQYVIYADIMIFLYLLTAGLHYKIPFLKMLKHGILWLLSYFGMIMGALLSTMQFMLLLANNSGQQMPFEIFTGLSLHPIRLLMTIVPEVFGPNVWGAFFSQNYTSGMDAELVLGASTICILLASFRLFKMSFHVRYMIGLLFSSLIYACMAHFNIIAKIIYHLPALNMFRVPSRALFLFTFAAMVLVACSLNELGKNGINRKSMHAANLCVGIVIAISAILYQQGILMHEGERQSIKMVFGVPVILFAIYLVVYYGLLFLQRKKNRLILDTRKIIAVCALVLMVVQVMPYYSQADVSSVESDMSLSNEVLQSVGSKKVWTPDGSCGELVSNSAQTYPVQGLNAYTNFNLPYLYQYLVGTTIVSMNATGMYNAFANTEDILRNKNDLISMLGVKYLLVNPDKKVDQYMELQGITNKENILNINDGEFLATGDYQIAAWPIELEQESYYEITLAIKAEKEAEQFYVDFAAPGYDNLEQEHWFVTEEGEHQYTAIIFSGDCNQVQDIKLRIIALTMQNLEIASIRVDKVDVTGKQLYQLTSEEESYNIYQNLNAQDLIYAPQLVKPISKEERHKLYTELQNYDILKTSYLTDGAREYDFSQVNVEISGIVLKNNAASAQVKADSDCFVNFSQTYYPGWKAYIDGKRTEVYEVNGIIQGVFVPAGNHTVEFHFEPAIFYLGTIISLMTVMACISYSIYEHRKKTWFISNMIGAKVYRCSFFNAMAKNSLFQ